MLDMFAELRSDRPRIGIVTISGDPVRHDASDRLGRAKECLGRGEIAMFAQHHIDDGAFSIDRTTEILPLPCTRMYGRVAEGNLTPPPSQIRT